MPWNVQKNPRMDCKTRKITPDGKVLQKEGYEKQGGVKIGNISVQKFRALLRKKKNNVEMYGSKFATAVRCEREWTKKNT